jgi:hypothetical protein
MVAHGGAGAGRLIVDGPSWETHVDGLITMSNLSTVLGANTWYQQMYKRSDKGLLNLGKPERSVQSGPGQKHCGTQASSSLGLMDRLQLAWTSELNLDLLVTVDLRQAQHADVHRDAAPKLLGVRRWEQFYPRKDRKGLVNRSGRPRYVSDSAAVAAQTVPACPRPRAQRPCPVTAQTCFSLAAAAAAAELSFYNDLR